MDRYSALVFYDDLEDALQRIWKMYLKEMKKIQNGHFKNRYTPSMLLSVHLPNEIFPLFAESIFKYTESASFGVIFIVNFNTS